MATQDQPVVAPTATATADVFVRKSSGLKRQVGGWDAVTYCILNSGCLNYTFFLVFALGVYPGYSVYGAMAIGLTMLVVVGVYWHFSIAMPRSGGEYVYLTRVLSPGAGFTVSFIISVLYVSFVGVGTEYIISYVLQPMLRGLAFSTGHSGWNSAANTVGRRGWQALIGTGVIGLIAFMWLRGPRSTMRLMWAGFTVGIAGLVTVLVVLIANGHSGFVRAFNKSSGATYQGILHAAAKGGLLQSAGFKTTLAAGVVFVFLGLLGTQCSANIAGEVRNIRRSQTIALFGSVVISLALWSALYATVSGFVGHNMYQALAGLWNAGDKGYPLQGPPMIGLLLGFGGGSPAVVLFGIFLVINQVASGAGLGFATTRNLFAWSFDRLAPMRLTELSRRGQPKWTILVTLLGAELFLLLAVFQPAFTTYLDYSVASWMVGWIILGVGAVVFPYVRREMFAAAPPAVQKRIGTIPLVSILGVLMVAVCGVSFYYSAKSFWEGDVPRAGIITSVVVIVLPIVSYVGWKLYRSSRGMPSGVQFKALPPE
jgi:amino acid transporter